MFECFYSSKRSLIKWFSLNESTALAMNALTEYLPKRLLGFAILGALAFAASIAPAANAPTALAAPSPTPPKSVAVLPGDRSYILISDSSVTVTTGAVPAQLASTYFTHGALVKPGTNLIAYNFNHQGVKTYNVAPGGYDFLGIGSGAAPIIPNQFPRASIVYR